MDPQLLPNMPGYGDGRDRITQALMQIQQPPPNQVPQVPPLPTTPGLGATPGGGGSPAPTPPPPAGMSPGTSMLNPMVAAGAPNVAPMPAAPMPFAGMPNAQVPRQY